MEETTVLSSAVETSDGVQHELKARIGGLEFESRGREEAVNSQFDKFLELARIATTSAAVFQAPALRPHNNNVAAIHDDADDGGDGCLDGLWARAYRRIEDRLSLNVLPQTERCNGDAIVLIIYGYNVLMKQDSVTSLAVMEAAKQSGLRIDRLDRSLTSFYNSMVIKGGSGKGSRYGLTNRGLAYAQEILEGMFE